MSLLAGVFISSAPLVSADVVTEWNLTAAEVSQGVAPFVTTPQNTNVASRIQAIEAIAVYNAVNTFLHGGDYYGSYSAPPGSPSLDAAKAAAASAARDVLAQYCPASANVAELNRRLAARLAQIADGPAKSAGVQAGQHAAAHIIGQRAADGASASVAYPGGASVGQWRPTPGTNAAPFTFPAASTPQWGGVRPFVLPSATHFVVPAPPAVGSGEYHRARAQVKTLGEAGSHRRSVDQTHIAQFWRQNAELPVNEAARLLIEANEVPLYESAHVLLLVELAIADARIAAYRWKYHFGYWRPVTALNAEKDGSVVDNYQAWLPLNVTPSHPSYPAGTPSAATAGFTVLRHFFGDLNAFTLQSTTSNPPQRSFERLSQAEAEAGASRVYGGIHWPFDIAEAQSLARKVADYVIAQGPQPRP